MFTKTTTDIVRVDRLRSLRMAGYGLTVLLISSIPKLLFASQLDDLNAFADRAGALGNQICEIPFGLWSVHTAIVFVENTLIVFGYHFITAVWFGVGMIGLLAFVCFCYEALTGEALFS